MAVGCSHGHLADPNALKAVLKFKKAFKPDRVFHLGDLTDQTAFRTGAGGTRDESVSITDDLRHGIDFLHALEPTDFLIGNHEARLWRLADHHNVIIARAANSVIEEIRQATVKLHCRFVDHYDINRSWVQLGDTKLMHGFQYSEMALRDTAEHFGKCIIAHLHVAGMAAGRRSDHPVGYCVGTLANVPSMHYASTNRSTSRWSHGFCFGEYSDTQCHVNLSQCQQNEAATWRLPV